MASPLLPVGLLGTAPERGAALRAAGFETLAGDAALAARCDVVVVGGEGRAARLREVLARGAHAFAAWPPTASVEATERLAAMAEEAGAEVGVGRPLPVARLLAGRPAGWRARLATVELAAAPGGRLAAAPPAHRLAGGLDLCAALVGRRALADLDVEAHRWPADGSGVPPGALAAALRFRNGAFATLLLRDAPHVRTDHVSVFAAGGAGTLSATSLDGPLCLDGAPRAGLPDGPGLADEAAAFVAAIRAGAPPPFSLHDALATLRLAERVAQRIA